MLSVSTKLCWRNIFDLLWVGLLATTVLGDTAPTGTCATFAGTTSERLVNPCSGVVNYAYFVPTGKTVASLQAAANTQLSAGSIAASSAACAERVIRLVCAQVYLKCYADVNTTDPDTFNPHIYHTLGLSYSTPVYRPCMSTCSEALQQCSTSLYGLSPGISPSLCSSTFDYAFGNNVTGRVSNPAAFDTNASTCFSPLLVPIAGQIEEYQHRNDGSFCSGFASTIFVTSGNLLNPSFAVTQLPGAVQRGVYQALAQRTASLPVFIEERCMLALRKYLCYQAFFAPQTITLRRALQDSGLTATIASMQSSPTRAPLLASTLSVPQFPEREVCLEYQSTCARLIAGVNATANRPLIPNCTAIVPSRPGVFSFPLTNQTVSSMSTPIGLINFVSTPNTHLYFNASEYSYTTQCPTGFVVPENPDSERITWVGGSGCSMSCRVPLWTIDEWERLLTSQVALPIASIVLAVAFVVSVLSLPRKEIEKFYLLVVFAVISLVASVTTLVVNTAYPWQDHWCYDSATPYRQEYGPNTPCMAQGVVLSFCLVAGAVTVWTMAVHHHLMNSPHLRRIVNKPSYFACQAALILGLPAIMVAIVGSNDGFAFARTAPWCSVKSPAIDSHNLDVRFMALPTLVLSILAVAIATIDGFGHVPMGRHRRVGAAIELQTVAVVSHPAKSVEDEKYLPVRGDDDKLLDAEEGASNSPGASAISTTITDSVALGSGEGGSAMALTKRGGGPATPSKALALIVLAMFGTLYLPYMLNKVMVLRLKHEIQNSFQNWIQCVFTHYKGSDDDYLAVCGAHADPRSPWSFTVYTGIILSGNMIMVGPCALALILWEWRSKK